MRVRIGEFVAAVCVVAWGVARVWAAPWCDRCEVERETAAWVPWYNTGAVVRPESDDGNHPSKSRT